MALKILFWDIDGTLVDTDRAGMYAWLQALEEEYGDPIDLEGLDTAGLTDVRIAEVVIQQLWGEGDDDLERAGRLLSRYEQLLPEWLVKRVEGSVLPGVRAILDASMERDDVDLALLTGNIAGGAEAKLRHYDLWGYFSFGAFADGITDRRRVARGALAEARRRHRDAIDGVYVIGDTDHDIDCGKAIGARTIAVGTGPFSAAELEAHDPWWAVERLPVPEKFFDRLDA